MSVPLYLDKKIMNVPIRHSHITLFAKWSAQDRFLEKFVNVLIVAAIGIDSQLECQI